VIRASHALDDVDLVVFDKDGTLIDFHFMWSGWVEDLAEGLERSTGAPIRAPLFSMMGYDSGSGRAHTGGGLVSTPMARLRDLTAAVLHDAGVASTNVEAALRASWHPPDPVRLARPLADLPRLFGGLRASGRRCAIATSDDRAPTVRTLEALGIAGFVDAMVCADDGVPAKPAPDMVTHLCALMGMDAGATAVVGDSPADMAMGRSARARVVIGVRTGIGTERDLAVADVVLDDVGALVEEDAAPNDP
jgi:phosphoglycolate phosphatase